MFPGLGKTVLGLCEQRPKPGSLRRALRAGSSPPAPEFDPVWMLAWPCGCPRLTREETVRGRGVTGEKSGLISLPLVQDCFPKALLRTTATSGECGQSNDSDDNLLF